MLGAENKTMKRMNIKDALSTWKDKLRDDCKKQIREHRSQWIARHRTGQVDKDAVVNGIGDLVKQAMAEPTLTFMGSEHGAAGFDKQLSMEGFAAFEPGEMYTDSDISEALKSLEQQLFTELIALELERIEQEQSMAAATLLDQAFSGHKEGLLCPVCSQGMLVYQHGWLACSHEKFQLDLRKEGLTLECIVGRFASVYEEHGASACSGRLQFFVEEQWGTTNMLAKCSTCSAYHVVV